MKHHLTRNGRTVCGIHNPVHSTAYPSTDGVTCRTCLRRVPGLRAYVAESEYTTRYYAAPNTKRARWIARCEAERSGIIWSYTVRRAPELDSAAAAMTWPGRFVV